MMPSLKNSLVFQANMVLATLRQQGMQPAEFHINPNSFKLFVEETEKDSARAESLVSRLLRRYVRPPKITEVKLCGLPLIENVDVPATALAVRMDVQMSDPEWLRASLRGKVVQIAQESGQMETRPAEEQELQVDELHLACQRRPGGRPTASALLVRALEDIDSYDDVIVLRVGQRGEIDMLTTLPRVYAFGVLHSALSRMGGE